MAISKKFRPAWEQVLFVLAFFGSTLVLTLLVGAGVTFYRLSANSLSLSSTPEPTVQATRIHLSKTSPRVALLCSPMGSTPFETLVPLAILPQVELVSYSSVPQRCRIARGLSMTPQHALGDANLPHFDAWILPPLAASDSPVLWDRLMDQLSAAPTVLALGESVRFAAVALGQTKRPIQLAVPYSTQKEISKSFPEARWTAGKRVVIHADSRRTVISSPGLSATPEAARALLSALKKTQFPAQGPGQPPGHRSDAPQSIPRLSIPDLAQFVRWVGFQPKRLNVRVTLQDGLNEWGLAAILEVFGKSGATALTYPSQAVTTQRGYRLHVTPDATRTEPYDLEITPDSGLSDQLEHSEQSALARLYRAVGVGSENWIHIFANRLMLGPQDLTPVTDVHASSATQKMFGLVWFGFSALALLALKLIRHFYFKSTRHRKASPLSPKRRGNSK